MSAGFAAINKHSHLSPPESFCASAEAASSRPVSEIELLCNEQEKAIEVLGLAINRLESSLDIVLAPDLPKNESVGVSLDGFDVKTQLGDIMANRVHHLKRMASRVESIIHRLGI